MDIVSTGSLRLQLLHYNYLLYLKVCLNLCFSKVVQRQGEIIVVYPFTPHSGFKTGWNIQEAVNFADEWWVEPAVLAVPCDCKPHISQYSYLLSSLL